MQHFSNRIVGIGGLFHCLYQASAVSVLEDRHIHAKSLYPISLSINRVYQLHNKIVSMIRKYQNHKLQTNSWQRKEESHNNQETPGRHT